MTDKEIIIDGKIIGCPCYIDRPLHRYHKGCLIQSQAFKEQQTEEKPILRCDEIKNCAIKENFKQLQYKTAGCEGLKKGYTELIEIIKPYMDDFTGYNEELGGFGFILCVKELLQQLDKLKAENEELKDYARRQENQRETYYKEYLKLSQECEEHKSNAESYCNSYQSSCKVNGEITHKMFKYEQTLNDIEKYFLKQCEIHKSCVGDYVVKDMCKQCAIKKNLDVINKAKGNKWIKKYYR